VAVEDHGLEVLKKSGEEVTAGDKSDYYIKTSILSGLVPKIYDYIALTYVAAGNGAGEIETAIYKKGGSGGTSVATLTLTYNSDDEIATVTRS